MIPSGSREPHARALHICTLRAHCEGSARREIRISSRSQVWADTDVTHWCSVPGKSYRPHTRRPTDIPCQSSWHFVLVTCQHCISLLTYWQCLQHRERFPHHYRQIYSPRRFPLSHPLLIACTICSSAWETSSCIPRTLRHLLPHTIHERTGRH